MSSHQKGLPMSAPQMKSLITLLLLPIVTFIYFWQHSNAHKTMSVETKLYLIDDAIRRDRVVPAVSDFVDHRTVTGASIIFKEATSTQAFQDALENNRDSAEYLKRMSADLLKGKLPDVILDDT